MHLTDRIHIPHPNLFQIFILSPLCRLDSTTSTCADVNECLAEHDYCQDGFCQNTVGGATCECQAGWQLDTKARKCVDMREGTCYDDYRSFYILKDFLKQFNRVQLLNGGEEEDYSPF